ncbi:MAG: MBOAT family O-acyltransferase [Anaerolineae bacterium]|nr:MBOAT family O-acyltransferase [Anaerolineae bacterium]
MSFISPEYIIFFSIVLPLFFWMPHRYRWMLLLVMSYFFYAYGNIQYVPLIAFSTIVDYIAARMIHRSEAESERRLWLAASIIVNLGVLFFFKYFNFFNESSAAVLGYTPFTHNLVLPIGISFYTFQSMSYTIDVFRRKMDAEPHLGIMATYVAFFPQLVAGPIERATNLLPQFHVKKLFNEDRAVAGLQQILWGFFKKVVIADRIAIYVNAVYNNVDDHSGWTLIIATFFFAFQIYCDFSGYSDIAIGTAKIMGFDLMQNFRQPYFSQSIREFWTRWHISLSTWFRDYVYYPLGGNRVPLLRNLSNLLIVFLVSGLWHGAGWTFVIWGALHGAGVVLIVLLRHFKIEIMSGKSLLMLVLRVVVTFVFVDFAWIFFRANSFADAQYVVSHLFVFDGSNIFAPFEGALLGIQTEFYLSFVLIGFLILVDAFDVKLSLERFLIRVPLVPRWGAYWLLGAAVIFSGLYGSGAGQFIYFQF